MNGREKRKNASTIENKTEKWKQNRPYENTNERNNMFKR